MRAQQGFSAQHIPECEAEAPLLLWGTSIQPEMELGLQTASLRALRNGLAASTASCVLPAWRSRQLPLFVLALWGWTERGVESGQMGLNGIMGLGNGAGDAPSWAEHQQCQRAELGSRKRLTGPISRAGKMGTHK